MHLVWHRRDLRVHDLPALQAALEAGPTLGVAVLDPEHWGSWSPRRRAWYAANLERLRDAYRERGSELVVREGDPREVLPDLAADLDVDGVHVTRAHDPVLAGRDDDVGDGLPVPLREAPGAHVQEPGTISSQEGVGYRIFSDFSRSWLRREVPAPAPAPDEIPAPEPGLEPGGIPEVDADVPLPEAGGEAARRRLRDWLDGPVREYHELRRRLDGSGTSRLSPHLAVGSLSPRLAAREALVAGGQGARTWVESLVWRDFLADLLARRPRLREEPLSRRWKSLDRREDEDDLEAWAAGETGIPVVDAAQRQLREEGWASARARTVAAQFLVKHLLLPWRWGAEVFRERLLDVDPALNVGNWQRAAGLGVGESPHVGVLDPVEEGRDHDPDGSWLEEWVPESGGDPEPLDEAMVDLDDARQRYLARAERVAGRG